MFDKSKVDDNDKYLREGEDGLRWSQEVIDEVEAMDMDDIMERAGVTQDRAETEVEEEEKEEEGKASKVTPQKPEKTP